MTNHLRELHPSKTQHDEIYMKLIDGNEVATLLGISKSTLFRWCDISEASEDANSVAAVLAQIQSETVTTKSPRSMHKWAMGARDETPKDFPRPFKIGRAYKWSDEEIMQWLEKKRV
ncbi:helix-turn-helix transcriptional regulator [Aeromonas intestinalis]